MFRVDPGADRALRALNAEHFLDRMVDWVSKTWPEQRADGDPRPRVRRMVDEAARFGLRHEACVARYVAWRCELGDALFRHPGMEGTLEFLSDPELGEREKVDGIDEALYGRSFLDPEVR